MYESFIIFLVFIVIYCPSPSYSLALLCNVILYFYQYILTAEVMSSVSLIIGFLNKLNSASINPLIFWLIIMWVSSIYHYVTGFFNTSTVGALLLLTASSAVYSGVTNSTFVNLAYVKIAPALTNGLLVIHPIVLYAFYGAIVHTYMGGFAYTVSQAPAGKYLGEYYIKKSQPWVYLTGAIALGLGSWWSYQELNWGGFWSWDLVEIFLLISVTYSLLYQHLVISTQFSYLRGVFFFTNFIIYIYSVRYNLINSIHNFISQASFSYKITYLLCAYTVCIVLLMYTAKLQRRKVITSYKYQYLLMLLEGTYAVLIGYVFLTYLGFYLFSSSSLLLINSVPLLLHLLVVALLIRYVSVSVLFLPLVEALLLSGVWFIKLRSGFNWIMHCLVFLLLGSLIMWYGIILLAPTATKQQIMDAISYSAPALVGSIQTMWSGLCYEGSIASNYLYLSTLNPKALVTSAYSLVIYAIPAVGNGFSTVLFSHKFFAKVSFVESQVVVFICLFALFVINSQKRGVISF